MMHHLVTAKLREAMGLEDVTDFAAALSSIPKDELAEYLNSVLADGVAAAEIATLMGAPAADNKADATPEPVSGGFYRKSEYSEEDEKWAVGRGKKKGGGASASSAAAPAPTKAAHALVGGATVVKGKPSVKEKRRGNLTGASGLDSLRSTLRPGRHPCSCNARRCVC